MARINKQPRVRKTYTSESYQVEYDERLFYVTILYDFELKKRFVEDIHWYNSGTVVTEEIRSDDWDTVINLIEAAREPSFPVSSVRIDRNWEPMPCQIWDRFKVR